MCFLRLFQTNLLLRIIAHFVISLIFGYLYRGVGNDASKMLANMVFLYGTNLFLVYTGQMAVIVSCKYQTPRPRANMYYCVTQTHLNFKKYLKFYFQQLITYTFFYFSLQYELLFIEEHKYIT